MKDQKLNQSFKMLVLNFKLGFALCALIFALFTNLSEVQAQTVDPLAWQQNAQGLNINQDASRRTAGLEVIIKADSQWPFFSLKGGVHRYYGALAERSGIDLGLIRIPGQTGNVTNQTADWAHNKITFGSDLNVWGSRLSPAILTQTQSSDIQFLSGNVRQVLYTNGVVTDYSAITQAPSLPKYMAYRTASGIVVQSLGNISPDLSQMSENWILVWYGNNSHFVDTKKPSSYTSTMDGRQDWDIASLPQSEGYQADAPILIRFENRPQSITQSTTEGGITVNFGSSSAGYTSLLPLFGREHLKAVDTEGWSSNLPQSVVNKINTWTNYLCFYPESVSETHTYQAGAATFTENVTFIQTCSQGIKLVPIPPVIAVASEVLPINFSGTVTSTNTHSEYGPIVGIEDNNITSLTSSYTWSFGGLNKYTESSQVLQSGVIPDDLQPKLANEINKLFDSNGNPIHFDPWIVPDQVPTGTAIGYTYWTNPADTLYHLIEVAPVLPVDLQDKLRLYVQREKQQYSPDIVFKLNYGLGQQRSPFAISDPAVYALRDTETAHAHSLGFNSSVPLYNFYALEKYFSFTGEQVDQNTWDRALTVFDAAMSEQDWATLYWFKGKDAKPSLAVENINRHLAGLIGIIKLAKARNDTATFDLAQTAFAKAAVLRAAMAHYPRYYEANSLLEYPTNPNWQPIYSAGKWHGHIWKYNWTTSAQDHRQVRDLSQFKLDLYDHSSRDMNQVGPNPYLITFKDMVPEIGRFLRDNVKTETEIFIDNYLENYPQWFYSFAESGLAREHSLNHPVDAFQIFLAKAWVKGESADQLHKYTDIPWLDSGDFFYMQKLAETIKAYQGWAWSDTLASGPCTLNSVSWSTNTALVNTAVNLTTQATGNCSTNNIRFEVRRSGTVFGVDDIPAQVQPNNNQPVAFTNGQASTTWTTESNPLIPGTIPQYYFRVSLDNGNTWSSLRPSLLDVTLASGGGTGDVTPTLTPTPTSTPTLTPTITPASCTIQSASWDVPGGTSSVTEGTTVNLNITGSGQECQGQTVSLEIYEDDALGDDLTTTLSATFNQATATTTWTTTWQQDVSGLGGDPEYYFSATLGGSSSNSVNLTVTRALGGTTLSVSNITDNAASYPNSQVPKYEKYEITFNVNNSIATNFQMPFDPAPPSGIATGSGITVNAEFLPPGQSDWNNAYKQPAFFYQDFDYQVRGNRDWIYPTANYAWKVRFAPNQEGNWQYRLTAQDNSGIVTSQAQSFTVTTSSNKGFIKVSPNDTRYFEFEDGTYFPGLGYNMNFNQISWNNPVLDNQANFQVMNQNGIQLIRAWLDQWGIFSSTQNPWRSLARGADYDAMSASDPRVPGFSPYPGSEFSMVLQWQWNPTMFLGWMKNAPAVKPNTNYHVSIRYLIPVDLTGPRVAGQPYGLVTKLHPFWLDNPQDIGTGTVVTTRAYSSPKDNNGNAQWSTIEGSFNSGNGNFLGDFYLTLENVTDQYATGGGTFAYIDLVEVKEDLGGGQYGPNIIAKPSMAMHKYFGQEYSYRLDKVLELAKQNNIYLKLSTLNHNDYLLNGFSSNGNYVGYAQCDTSPWHELACFYGNGTASTKVGWLQQAWWRYLQARWGYSTNVHSWEMTNEGDPDGSKYAGATFTLPENFGKFMHQFANSHLTTTSFWGGFPTGFWGNAAYSNMDYADIHRYIDNANRPAEFRDTAYATQLLSSQIGAKTAGGVNKPTMRGETGLTDSGTEPETTAIQPDFQNQNIWLQKFIWGQINSGGVMDSGLWYPNSSIYNGDYTHTIDHRNLFGNYYNFIKDIPLNNGNYVDAAATASDANLRAWGQKDLTSGQAHLWIDNRTHTWNNVVSNPGAIVNVSSATVTIPGLPQGIYTASWYDTYTGTVSRTEDITIGTDGVATLTVTNLGTDTAVKLANQSITPSPSPSATPTPTPTPTPGGSATITLNPATTYQTMTGWEVNAQQGALGCATTDFVRNIADPAKTVCPAFNLYKDSLFDQAVNDLGINRVRLEANTGMENPRDYYAEWLNGAITTTEENAHWYESINDNADPNVINSNGFKLTHLDHIVENSVLPLKQRVETRGEKLYINLEVVDFNSHRSDVTLRYRDNPAEYAEFVLAIFQHLQTKYGFVPDAVEIVLEPDNGGWYWSGAQVGAALVAARNRLNTNGFNPDFIAPSTMGMNTASTYFDALTSPALAYLKEISYHRYSGVSDTALQNVATRAVNNNLKTAMLEHIGADYNELHQDLTIGRNSAWQQFTLAYPTTDNGAQYYTLDVSNPNSPVINMGSRTRSLRQYFKFIRFGAIRIGASSQNANFDPVAFMKADGKTDNNYTVAVKANAGGNFSIGNLPAGTYGIKYTTLSQYDIDLTDQTITAGQNLSTNIPAAGVITIYSKAVTIPTPTPTTTPASCTFTANTALWNTPSTPGNASVNLSVTGADPSCVGQTVNFNIRKNEILTDTPVATLTATVSASLTATTTWTTPAWFDDCGGIDPRVCNPSYHFDAVSGSSSQKSPDLTITQSIPTSPTDWPQVQKDPQHTGYSNETLGTNFQVAWTHPFQPDRVFPQTQAIVYQGKVFVGTEGANGQQPRMLAFNAGSGSGAGQVVWQFVADGPIVNSAVADNSRIYFATLNGSVYALDTNGNQVWQQNLGADEGFAAAPIVADNKILIGGQNGYFYALNPDNGVVVWQYNVGKPLLQTAAYNNGKVFAGSQNLSVYAFNTSPSNVNDPNTILAWRSSRLTGLSLHDYWPVVTQGRVLVRTMNYQTTNFYSIDEQTGAVDTTLPQYDGNTHGGTTTPPCVDRNNLLLVPMEIGWQGGWGRLNLSTRAATSISQANIGAGNPDENLNVSCANNLLLTFHTEEMNAHYTGFYNLDTSSWTRVNQGYTRREMTSNTQGSGGNPPSISNGMVYHISYDELVARTTN